MTAAQAAQQSNRHTDGTYAAKTRSEQDAFTPPARPDDPTADEYEMFVQVDEIGGYGIFDDFPQYREYADNDEQRAYVDAASAMMQVLNDSSGDGVDVFVEAEYDGDGGVDGYVIGSRLEPEPGEFMRLTTSPDRLSGLHGGGPAPRNAVETFRAMRNEMVAARARYTAYLSRVTFRD